jgi:hypothetical protein
MSQNKFLTIKNYRLCSYAGCSIITKTDVPRLCEAGIESDLTPIYCENHLRIMRIMTQLSDKNKNNIEYKNCLKCGTVINKLDGCNHMKCNCGFEFCWVCDYVKNEESDENDNNRYKHPSYCRGNYSWEEGMFSLSNLLNEFYREINDINLNNVELNAIYGKWFNETLVSYPIYAVSFWDLDLWIRKKISDRPVHSPPMQNNIGYNISILIGNICEWVGNPYTNDLKMIIYNLLGLLNELKYHHPDLFVIPEKFEILQYE